VMKSSVGELMKLVGGHGQAGAARPVVSVPRAKSTHHGTSNGKPAISTNGNGNGHHPVASLASRQSEIPLEDAFKDF
jgi:hypothetical protein